jgi:hypothetical protein
MTDETRRNRDDQVWPAMVRWDLGGAGAHAHDVLWQCEAQRAGQLYNKSLFGTQEEAEAFAEKMREVEPDQMFRVEAIKASAVWN